MKLNFRLKEILEERNSSQRGVINAIARDADLKRHQVAALLHNKAKYLSLETLERICAYLVDHHKVDPQLLPGLLFGHDDSFWDLLAKREHLELCLGIRHSGGEAWVTENDALLQGALLYGISSPGVAAKRQAQSLHQHLIMAPDPQTGAPDKIKAESLYQAFAQRGSNRALVAVGSVKIDSITELIVSQAMRVDPFRNQDAVRRPQDRKCPFMFCYRKIDPKPPSCCGGMKLARSMTPKDPGIYYEQEDGQWTGCPWTPTQDAAVIFYNYRPAVERLEVVLGGFSGRATRWLDSALRTWAAKLWPPCYMSPELEIGAFIVKYQFEPPASKGGQSAGSPPKDIKVVPLAEAVFKRRLERK